MAQSRIHKIGTIYSRVTGLLVTAGIDPLEKPMWYQVYKAFPPKYEPRFDRQAPYIPVRNIFYKEDAFRARFHKEYPQHSDGDLLHIGMPTITEKFIAICMKLEQKQVSENAIYEYAVKALMDVEPKFSVENRDTRNDNRHEGSTQLGNLPTERSTEN